MFVLEWYRILAAAILDAKDALGSRVAALEHSDTKTSEIESRYSTRLEEIVAIVVNLLDLVRRYGRLIASAVSRG